MVSDPRVIRLARAIAGRTPQQVASGRHLARAAVALVVRPEPHDLEVLLIERATHEGDPWSGHIALPGGRQDPADPDLLTTAIRETHEEVGIDLRGCGIGLGALDELQPLAAGVPVLAISPFAFAVPAGTRAMGSPEVAGSMWVPLGQLADPATRAEYLHLVADGQELRFPALLYQGYTVWGLTYRILTEFLQLTGVGRKVAG